LGAKHWEKGKKKIGGKDWTRKFGIECEKLSRKEKGGGKGGNHTAEGKKNRELELFWENGRLSKWGEKAVAENSQKKKRLDS